MMLGRKTGEELRLWKGIKAIAWAKTTTQKYPWWTFRIYPRLWREHKALKKLMQRAEPRKRWVPDDATALRLSVARYQAEFGRMNPGTEEGAAAVRRKGYKALVKRLKENGMTKKEAEVEAKRRLGIR